MKVLFAPDWRNGVPYQRLLAEALGRAGATVQFLQGYKRVLPLTRLLARHRCDILHLHWPEAYYPKKEDGWDWFRRARFSWDLRGATKRCALATTAHNLHAHNRATEPFALRNTRAAHERAGVVFAHSPEAKLRLAQAFALDPTKVQVIPHGDLSVTLGEPAGRAEARNDVGIRGETVALMFGAVEPYKGQEEIIRWWRGSPTEATLAIVGNPIDDAYREHIRSVIGGDPRIHTEFGWLSDDRLRLWLSAADAAIFNYREIFTSGAANLARSWGLPIVLPERLATVWLDEPSPWVFRFAALNMDFFPQLCRAMVVQQGFSAARDWRRDCSWDRVAKLTMEGYRRALDARTARVSQPSMS
jgi:beta-1,4-mannosyltransferase